MSAIVYCNANHGQVVELDQIFSSQGPWFYNFVLLLSYKLWLLIFFSLGMFLCSTFLFRFIMQTLSIVSSIKTFNKHVVIDHFQFKREMRIKERLIN